MADSKFNGRKKDIKFNLSSDKHNKGGETSLPGTNIQIELVIGKRIHFIKDTGIFADKVNSHSNALQSYAALSAVQAALWPVGIIRFRHSKLRIVDRFRDEENEQKKIQLSK